MEGIRSSSFEFYHCFNAHCTFSKNIQRYSFYIWAVQWNSHAWLEKGSRDVFSLPKNFNSFFCIATINSLDGFILEKLPTDHKMTIMYFIYLSKFKKMMPCTVRKGEVETEFSSRQRKRSSSIFEQTRNFWCRIFSNRFRLSCVQRQDLSITLLASIAILVMTNREKIVANLSSNTNAVVTQK